MPACNAWQASRQSKAARRLVVDRRREHSRKPDAVRERIDEVIDGLYLELFARETIKWLKSPRIIGSDFVRTMSFWTLIV